MSDKTRAEEKPVDREPKKRKHPEDMYSWVSNRQNFRKMSKPKPRSAR